MSYSCFASYYDRLTLNVDYKGMADSIYKILRGLNHDPGLLIDVACGTGSLTIELAKKNINVIGIDRSIDMLTIAQQKSCGEGLSIVFLNQEMQSLDLYENADTFVCSLDSINHMIKQNDVEDFFRGVSNNLNPGGLFIFDVNTLYKHHNILANNVFIYDLDDIYCVWQNSLEEKSDLVKINLEFFERDGHIYYRSDEEFFERAYQEGFIEDLIMKNNFKVISKYGDEYFCLPNDTNQRLIYVCQKK